MRPLRTMAALLCCAVAASCSSVATRSTTGELRKVEAAEAFARRFPEEITLIAFRDEAGAPGIAVLGNRRIVSMVSLKKDTPAQKAVSVSGEFVIAFPGEDLKSQVLACFAAGGATGDSFAKLGLATGKAERVNAPLLTGCLANYECRVKKAYDAGDSVLFDAQLAKPHWSESPERRLYLLGYRDGQPLLGGLSCARGTPVPRWFEKYPEQIAMVTSCDEDGKPNAMTLGNSMRVSDDPPMVAVMIAKGHHTHKLIRSVNEFVYGYPGADMDQEMLYCGTHTGKEVDKFAAVDLAPKPASTVRPPLLGRWLAAFECTVAREVGYGSHTIFVGNVQAAHVSDKGTPRIWNWGAGDDGERVFRPIEPAGR